MIKLVLKGIFSSINWSPKTGWRIVCFKMFQKNICSSDIALTHDVCNAVFYCHIQISYCGFKI